MIYIKSQTEIQKIRESCRIIALLLEALEHEIKPGVNTLELDRFADDFIRSHGGIPSFKGYSVAGLKPYPAAICASVNAAIVHGLPSKETVLKDGDIIGIDVGVLKQGYHGDAARTYKVGAISSIASKLMDVTLRALETGIEYAITSNRIGDISAAIGAVIKTHGFYPADDLTGHGVGKYIHEEPLIPNVGVKGRGPRIVKGMTLAIEPMVNIGTNRVVEKGWEYFTADNSLSAHFEHTILVTDSKPEILSIA